MIRIGICDDEEKMRRSLRIPLERTLELSGQDYRILEYDSGETLLCHVKTDQPDILFLDIEMKALNGMETARALRKQKSEAILIFVTAFPDFVFQGYDVHAFHYILKPYREQKIAEVLTQALKELDVRLEQFFTIELKAGTRRLSLKNVSAFMSDRRKITGFMENEEVEFYGKLTDVAEELPDYFIRIHNRYLANLNHITALNKEGCICGGRMLPVSRAYKQQLEVAFAKSLLR